MVEDEFWGFDMAGEYIERHKYPQYEQNMHEESDECWCDPIIDRQISKQVILVSHKPIKKVLKSITGLE